MIKEIKNIKQAKDLEASLLNDLERLFYPETANELTDSEYFSQDTVKNICETYSAKPNTFEKFVNKFKTEMQRAQSDNEQISILNIFRKNLKNSDLAASNPGLHKHLTKNFEFTIQQKLQEILQNRLNKQLLSEKDTTLIQMQNQAFSTAVKLDLLQEFNSLCIQYARQPNNQQLTTSIQSIFADFSQIDETTMSMDDAAELREEFLSRMQNTLSEELTTSQHKDTQHHFRKEIQKITSREHVDEDVKNVSNTENTPPHPK